MADRPEITRSGDSPDPGSAISGRHPLDRRPGMTLPQSATPVAFLYVSDRERALDFYRDTLGLELRSSDGFGDFIDLGGSLLRMTVMPDHQPQPHPVLGWNVGDIAAASGTLRERGVEPILYEG